MRYLIQLAYKGTNYHGWQKQHNAHSVQSVLDEKISLLLAQNIETLGCGRTDSGVHAKDFYAHFDAEGAVDCAGVVYRLNRMLPFDISVYDLKPVAENFNARFDAVYREYEYWIIQKRDPFLVEEAWYQYGELDVHVMNEAAQLLIGKKDFECFSKVQTQVNNFICDVQFAEWKITDDKLVFTIRANRFLRNMVRAIVGTLVDAGKGRIKQEDVKKILASKNRSEAGHSVPAHGLYLTRIAYE
ncbi:MAG: tRNA pseudouridine(38-40) synthase TruA [Bacteroidota bacterium]